MSAESTTIRWDQDDDGVVILTLDDPNQSANTMNAAYAASIRATVDRLEAERDRSPASSSPRPRRRSSPAATSTTSSRPPRTTQTRSPASCVTTRPCCAGWRRSASRSSPPSTARRSAVAWRSRWPATTGSWSTIPRRRRLSRGPARPAARRRRGHAHRADARDRQRAHAAAAPGPAPAPGPGAGDRARRRGRPHARGPDPRRQEVDRRQPGGGQQPWDVKGYKIPGGTPSTPSLAPNLPAFPANLRKQIKGANYPAPHHIMAAAVEGAQVDFDNASEIEGRYFVDLVTGQVAKNMIQAFFFDLQRATGNRGRPAEIETFTPTKVVVLGAGMMGAAIAYVCAKAGIEVVLKDVSQEAADQRQGLLREARRQGRRARALQPGGRRRAAGPDHPDHRPGGRRGRRARDRGGVRGPDGQGRGVRGDRAPPGVRRAAGLQHLDAADHRAGRQRHPAGRLHRAALLQPGGQDAAAGDHQAASRPPTRRSTARSTSPS